MGQRGPKTKPTALKLIDGSYRKTRANPNEPTPPLGIPKRPPFLDNDPIACEEWDYQVEILHACGVLAENDGAVLGAFCVQVSRLAQAQKELMRLKEQNPLLSLITKTTGGNYIQNPLIGISNRAMLIMARLAAEYGLTPSSRSGIEVNTHAPRKQEKLVNEYF